MKLVFPIFLIIVSATAYSQPKFEDLFLDSTKRLEVKIDKLVDQNRQMEKDIQRNDLRISSLEENSKTFYAVLAGMALFVLKDVYIYLIKPRRNGNGQG